MSVPTLNQGRLLILAGAVLWSLNGAFVKILTRPTLLDLGDPPVEGLVIAFYRVLFAALVLLPALRPADISFKPLMPLMALCFATMNAMFIWASAAGTAANAIFLQYTAPLWMYLVSLLLLKEPADRRNTFALVLAMAGIALIVGDAFRQPTLDTLRVVLVALGSGITFAGVLLALRLLRDASSQWLTVQNHVAATLFLLPVVWLLPTPTWPQVAFLALFGAVQLGIPYWLVSRGLKVVGPQEAGTLTLVELLLNPLWTYMVAGETPEAVTLYGGALILAALVWRYAPRRKHKPEAPSEGESSSAG